MRSWRASKHLSWHRLRWCSPEFFRREPQKLGKTEKLWKNDGFLKDSTPSQKVWGLKIPSYKDPQIRNISRVQASNKKAIIAIIQSSPYPWWPPVPPTVCQIMGYIYIMYYIALYTILWPYLYCRCLKVGKVVYKPFQIATWETQQWTKLNVIVWRLINHYRLQSNMVHIPTPLW